MTWWSREYSWWLWSMELSSSSSECATHKSRCSHSPSARFLLFSVQCSSERHPPRNRPCMALLHLDIEPNSLNSLRSLEERKQGIYLFIFVLFFIFWQISQFSIFHISSWRQESQSGFPRWQSLILYKRVGQKR